MTISTVFGKKYKVVRCTYRDVDKHYETVREIVADVPEELFKKRMRRSVKEKLAYKTVVDDRDVAFIYTKKAEDGNYGEGVCIWGKNSPIGFMLLMKDSFENYPYHKVLMYPHRDQKVLEYKSIIEGYSIREWHNNKQAPLVIKVDNLNKKYKPLYIKLTGKSE